MAAELAANERHLIALDLDGTVLDNEHHGTAGTDWDDQIPERAGNAIRALHAAGHEVVIATGRSVDATLPVVEALRIKPEWVIAANGAVTLRRDALAPRAYRREYVEAFDPSEALVKIRAQLLTARFAVELASGGFLYTEPIPTGTLPSQQRQVPFEELLGVQASRVVVVSPDHRLEEFLSAVETLGLTHVSYAVGRTSWLDIAPSGVTKASALEVVRSRVGIDRSRVFAAGDGRNDIDMLQWAGRFGDSVAMGQAVADVRAEAGRVTAPVDQDGLFEALRDRFPALLG
ncbi:haloacid dehalogenase [Leucobacter sp. OLJS4]|uniref:HAD family hydrolase n=1 Tax=unclassified Leucobacter TaxID=2621730 RepID=UPI000C17A15B|nr:MULTISPECIES: HAD hydrolase family protein [unclassified Leucobacter]PII85848.1 haloacid dehalogenase [Leucobacter sp. OLCALW19]PII92921.1 haloacid dehalogenase [Leucobacter sp. OLAS13]PII96464.1 haloacid dehalogenase [Leucobacter sp. OLTLW20]PII96520.1 haloacid dehalogenase [Leucobacter sp. OLCS4]PII96694.1 haloacid dehalogenase [Leucobacter sp. OLDS2]